MATLLRRAAAPLLLAALASGCGPADDTPGDLTVSESRALNEAAEALDLNVVTEIVPAANAATPAQ